jgi:hypothetical protein
MGGTLASRAVHGVGRRAHSGEQGAAREKLFVKRTGQARRAHGPRTFRVGGREDFLSEDLSDRADDPGVQGPAPNHPEGTLQLPSLH